LSRNLFFQADFSQQRRITRVGAQRSGEKGGEKGGGEKGGEKGEKGGRAKLSFLFYYR
jgi:hypothetical protein